MACIFLSLHGKLTDPLVSESLLTIKSARLAYSTKFKTRLHHEVLWNFCKKNFILVTIPD